MTKPLVFGIGCPKTGTSSLADALTTLGWKTSHDALWLYMNMVTNKASGKRILHNIVPHWQAITDMPRPHLHIPFDRHYPGSKFVLTTRDPGEWLDSVVRWRAPNPLTQQIVGITPEEYEAHNTDARNYFRGRIDDFLELRICHDEGWEKLCPFLGVSIPDEPFPMLAVNPRHIRSKGR